MNVGELIKLLANFDLSAEVVMPDGLPLTDAVDGKDGTVILTDYVDTCMCCGCTNCPGNCCE